MTRKEELKLLSKLNRDFERLQWAEFFNQSRKALEIKKEMAQVRELLKKSK